MMHSGNSLISMAAMAVLVALVAPGCATKKYVSQQINGVNQRVDQYHKEDEGKIAWLTNKQQNDISQVNERITTTDRRVTELNTAVQSANATASRAMQEADANKVQIQANNAAIANVRNSLNYQLVQRADVEFAFDKATLTPKAKAELDAIAAKARSMPRSVIELGGFTDPIGSPNYNLDLSRRRAWAVQRYLAQQNVPVRSIHVAGFGLEQVPQAMALSSSEIASARNKAATRQMERRVSIRLYGAGDLTEGATTQGTPTEQ
jgi:outer membrane protein OmpA-like peptidoglycan-associated protein